jgi:hypothetical protein
MVFVTALLWGTGISLGLCVGMVTWAVLCPLVVKHKELFDASLDALQERNRLTVEANEYRKRTAVAAENNALLRAIDDKMPKNADRETILLCDIIWLEVDGEITQGFVESISQGAWGDRCRGEYTIGWELARRNGLNKCGNLDCYSTRETAQAAKER